jgi:hypothetical protein
MNKATKQFRRVNGFMHLARLRTALDRYVDDQKASSTCYNKTVA